VTSNDVDVDNDGDGDGGASYSLRVHRVDTGVDACEAEPALHDIYLPLRGATAPPSCVRMVSLPNNTNTDADAAAGGDAASVNVVMFVLDACGRITDACVYDTHAHTARHLDLTVGAFDVSQFVLHDIRSQRGDVTARNFHNDGAVRYDVDVDGDGVGGVRDRRTFIHAAAIELATDGCDDSVPSLFYRRVAWDNIVSANGGEDDATLDARVCALLARVCPKHSPTAPESVAHRQPLRRDVNSNHVTLALPLPLPPLVCSSRRAASSPAVSSSPSPSASAFDDDFLDFDVGDVQRRSMRTRPERGLSYERSANTDSSASPQRQRKSSLDAAAAQATAAGVVSEHAALYAPLVAYTSSNFDENVTTHTLHVYNVNTRITQSYAWTPNEGVITGIGVSADERSLLVGVSKRSDHLVFEFDRTLA
jgi:hypothetical protein